MRSIKNQSIKAVDGLKNAFSGDYKVTKAKGTKFPDDIINIISGEVITQVDRVNKTMNNLINKKTVVMTNKDLAKFLKSLPKKSTKMIANYKLMVGNYTKKVKNISLGKIRNANKKLKKDLFDDKGIRL